MVKRKTTPHSEIIPAMADNFPEATADRRAQNASTRDSDAFSRPQSAAARSCSPLSTNFPAAAHSKRQKNGHTTQSVSPTLPSSPPYPGARAFSASQPVESTGNHNSTIPGPPRKYGSSLGDLVAAATLAEPVSERSTPTPPPASSSNALPNGPPNALRGGSLTPTTGHAPETGATPAPAAQPTQTATDEQLPASQPAPKKPLVDPQAVVSQFTYLLDKSQQLFAGLKEFTPLGTRPWQDYFKKTFEIYTKIWRFQQQYRPVLEREDYYALKRWQIGEIASKIGQLYHHYYMRTSETNYLLESYIFYYAIRERGYFRDITDVKNPALVVKKIRFYARFIVACMLLNDYDLAWKLLEESQALVETYARTFRPVDSKEWRYVMQEISTFLEAERQIIPRSPAGHLLNTPLRQPESWALPHEAARFQLQEVVLVGGYPNQNKFSELTADVYHMAQALEYEPSMAKASQTVRSRLRPTLHAAVDDSGDSPPTQASMNGSQVHDFFQDAQMQSKVMSQTKDATALRYVNPHKQLLFRPTYSHLMQNITQAFRDTPEHAAFLLYLSAPGVKTVKADKALDSGFTGGIATRSGKAMSSGDKPSETSELAQIANCLHPADLIPFTRKPLFLVVESSNSGAFSGMPRVFNQPFLCLMSPIEYLRKEYTQLGNLFTLFLLSPALGLTSLTGARELEPADWKAVQEMVVSWEHLLGEALVSLVQDKGVKKFMSAPLLRQLVIRHLACVLILSRHHLHQSPKLLPSSTPELPVDEVTRHPGVLDKLKEILVTLQVHDQFTPLFGAQATDAPMATEAAEPVALPTPTAGQTMEVDTSAVPVSPQK
ncbi:hypothetical protein H4R35_000570 [Dimargaris xerosporica]|nr:hypothetical protein H4R35_000570 [Dimargaris xerosporica]